MSQLVRLAFLITELEIGGAERCLVHLATGVDRARFDPVVYCLAPRPRRDGLVQRLERARVPARFLDLRSPWQLLTAIYRLRKLLAAQQPDVLQTFLFHANVLGLWAAGRRLAVATGVRVADPSRRRQRLEAWSSRRAGCVVCVSQAVADFCTTQAGFPRQKLRVIPNGVDLANYPSGRRISPATIGLAEGRRILLFVGRLHHQKAVDWLLSLAPEMLAQLPEHDLVLVGDGPQRSDLEKMIRCLGLTQRVHLLGWRPDVPDLLAAADALLLPSRWEGMPNAVLEAMAAGRPVIATRAAGVLELLGPAAAEQTVDHGDGASFVRAVVSIVLDPIRAEQLGFANRQRAAESFSLPAMVAAYEDLYRELIL